MGHPGNNHAGSTQGGPRQLSSFGMRVVKPISVSSRYNAIAEDDREDACEENQSTPPTVFDNISWKVGQSQKCRKSTPKRLSSKVEEYLYNGKTFSIDNFVKMESKSRLGSQNSHDMKAHNSVHQSTALKDFILPLSCDIDSTLSDCNDAA